MTEDVLAMAARPGRYENVDGTSELSFGLMILALMLAGYVTEQAKNSPLLMIGTLLPLLLIGHLLTRSIKRYITYPRTGYVAYGRMSKENRWRTILFAIGVAAVAAAVAALAAVIQRHQESGVVRGAMIFGFLWPYAFFVLTMSKEHLWKRYVILGMAAGLIAIALLVPGSTEALSRPVMLLSAVTWLGSGVATLVYYIRHTHAPVAGEE